MYGLVIDLRPFRPQLERRELTVIRNALRIVAGALAIGAIAAVPASAKDYAATNSAFNILTSGEAGDLISSENSVDQGKMYDALTPLRGNVTMANLQSGDYFKSEAFVPIQNNVTPAGYKCGHPPAKAGIWICNDSKKVPHVYVSSRADGAWTMGFLAARDRGLLISFGRGPGYVSALSVPGVSAFGLIQQARGFAPSTAAKAFMTKQVTDFGKAGSANAAVVADFTQWAAGVGAWYKSYGNADEKATAVSNPWTVEDAFAAFSFIGSIFGNGGGGEVGNSSLLAKLQGDFTPAQALKIYRDFRHSNDLDAPVSWKDTTFPYNVQPTNTTPSTIAGSKVIDSGSVDNTFARIPGAEPTKRYMSNALLVPASRSATGKPLAVMGPQLGYFYPEIVMEVDIHGGGYDFRGAVAPVAPYGLIGRGSDYAWSLTSASSDNTDQFVEKLCVPGGGTATRSSKYYEYKGVCKAMTTFDAGYLSSKGGDPARELSFYETVHGPVSGTVTIAGAPYAVSNDRANRGREPYSALALADLTLGKVKSSKTFFSTANKFDTTFNWHYVDNKNICFFSSGRLPIRATGLDSSLPTLGTGAYDWTGFLNQNSHPHGCNPKAVAGDNASALITNWNNHPANGWGAADDEWGYASTHRMGLFQRLFRTTRTAGKTLKLNDVVAVMNQAGTEDTSAVNAWPNVKRVLLSGTAKTISAAAPDSTTATFTQAIDTWITTHDASRIDTNLDGLFDESGVGNWGVAWPKIIDAVVEGRLSHDDASAMLGHVGRGDKTNNSTGVGFANKDLGRLLGDTFKSPYSQTYCGGAGGLTACRAALWAALQAASVVSITENPLSQREHFGPVYPNDPATGKEFTMRWVNRPTFQQAISFSSHR